MLNKYKHNFIYNLGLLSKLTRSTFPSTFRQTSESIIYWTIGPVTHILTHILIHSPQRLFITSDSTIRFPIVNIITINTTIFSSPLFLEYKDFSQKEKGANLSL